MLWFSNSSVIFKERIIEVHHLSMLTSTLVSPRRAMATRMLLLSRVPVSNLRWYSTSHICLCAAKANAFSLASLVSGNISSTSIISLGLHFKYRTESPSSNSRGSKNIRDFNDHLCLWHYHSERIWEVWNIKLQVWPSLNTVKVNR